MRIIYLIAFVFLFLTRASAQTTIYASLEAGPLSPTANTERNPDFSIEGKTLFFVSYHLGLTHKKISVEYASNLLFWGTRVTGLSISNWSVMPQVSRTIRLKPYEKQLTKSLFVSPVIGLEFLNFMWEDDLRSSYSRFFNNGQLVREYATWYEIINEKQALLHLGGSLRLLRKGNSNLVATLVYRHGFVPLERTRFLEIKRDSNGEVIEDQLRRREFNSRASAMMVSLAYRYNIHTFGKKKSTAESN